MPRGDGTGPAGQGSMTGSGLGYCSGNARAGFANNGFGCFGLGRGGRPWGGGMGRGFGRGRGRFFGYNNAPMAGYVPFEQARPTLEQEKNYLQEDIEGLENELNQMKKRLNELQKDNK